MIKLYIYSFLLLLISCKTNEQPNKIIDSNESIKVDRFSNIKFTELLNETNLRLKEKDSLIDFKLLRGVKNWRVLPLKNIKDVESSYKSWAFNNSFLDIYTFKIPDSSDMAYLKLEMNVLCSNHSREKTDFQKMFRNYKIHGDTLSLYKHNFFSKEDKAQYNKLVNYLNDDFDCW